MAPATACTTPPPLSRRDLDMNAWEVTLNSVLRSANVSSRSPRSITASMCCCIADWRSAMVAMAAERSIADVAVAGDIENDWSHSRLFAAGGGAPRR